MGTSANKIDKTITSNNLNEKILHPIFEEFLCCKCGEIPEILNVHTDNSKIELNCRNCGIYEILIDDYYNELYKNNYFKECSSCKNKGINNIEYYYCFTCNNIFCESCKNKEHTHHKYIKEKEKKRICLDIIRNLNIIVLIVKKIFVKKKGRRNIKIMK